MARGKSQGGNKGGRGETSGGLQGLGGSLSDGGGSSGGGGGRSAWAAVGGWLRGALVDNAAIKFVALVLALTVFILVHSDEQAVTGATVNVTYTMPADKVLVSNRVDQVRITVKGSRRRIRRFNRHELEPIHIDLTHTQNGELFFQPDMFDLPEGLDLVSITPASMTIHMEDRVVKQVPVSVDLVGTPGRGYRVAQVTAKPDHVEVSGAASEVARATSVHTAPVPLAGRQASFQQEVRLVPPPGLEVDGDRNSVQAQVTLGEELGSREVTLPVTILTAQAVSSGEAAKFQVQPDKVKVVLRGSILAIDRVQEGQLSAYVRLYPNDVASRRSRQAEVRIAPALAGIGYEISPPEVALQPRP